MLKHLLFILLFSISFTEVFPQSNSMTNCDCRKILIDMPPIAFQLFDSCQVTIEYRSGDCNGYCSVSIEKVTLSNIEYKDSISLSALIGKSIKKVLEELAKNTICSVTNETVSSYDFYFASCVHWTNKGIEPCGTEQCCTARYLVQFQGSGKTWKITTIDLGNYTRCDNPPDCFSICQ